MSKIHLRSLIVDDWVQYREIRLSSLQESPDAFGSTYGEECNFPTQKWKDRINLNDRVAHALPLIAELDGKAIGIACGIVHESGDRTGNIYQMWVAPEHRGKGIGKRLLNSIVNWAEGLHLQGLELDVTTTNLKAIHFYESIGFISSGEFNPVRTGSVLKTQRMKLKLE